MGRYPNGATKYYSVYGKTYSEVKDKLETIKSSEKIAQKSRTGVPTFSDVVEMWLSSVRIEVKKSTVYRYEYLIERHILPILGGYKITEISTSVINSFLEDKMKNGKLDGKGGLSAAYVKAMSNIIKMVIEFAVSQETMPSTKIQNQQTY